MPTSQIVVPRETNTKNEDVLKREWMKLEQNIGEEGKRRLAKVNMNLPSVDLNLSGEYGA